MDFTAISESFGTGWVVWMIVLFAGVIFWAFRPKNRKRRGENTTIPFGNDENGS